MSQSVKMEKTFLISIWVYCALIVLVLGLALCYAVGWLPSQPQETLYVLFVALALIVLLSLLLIYHTRMLRRALAQVTRLQDALRDLGVLNQTLRGQRHDFMNHLQVVYSLMETEDYADALSYIEQVYGDIHRVSMAMKTAKPAINAVLQAKLSACEKRNVSVVLRVQSLWSTLPVPEWEMCRVLGNIIDNALEALEESESPQLEIEIGEDLHHYSFRISNNGPMIAPENLARITREGFTTKRTGSGVGLAVVKNILTEYQGELRVESDERWTRFTGLLPRTAQG